MKIKGQPSDFKAELAGKRPALFSFVLGIVRNVDLAEDLTQDAMFRAYQSISRLRDHNRLSPWLYTIASNVCRDHFRKNKRTHEKNSVDNLRDENAPRLEKVLECAEMGECVQRYFNELSDSYRAVILLHDVEGMTNQEIADFMSISLDAAKIRLHRARKRLREILKDVCHFSIDERGVLICEPKHDKITESTKLKRQLNKANSAGAKKPRG